MELTVHQHRLSGVRQLDSPNQAERPAGVEPELLVIHNISLPPGEFGGCHIDELFLNRLDPGEHPFFSQIATLRVSAHLLIDRAGVITQYVPFDRMAWHAGQSCYRGRERCNEFSIGIELEGCDDRPFTDIQYARLTRVTAVLMAQYPALSPQRITGHSDIAPGRKTDPGPHFDWARYRDGLS
ncbi:MAG: 1,6-anhydro-N-acetylmuramyl-L-alanine amidase AmpD [Pseudomonadota bacterium]